MRKLSKEAYEKKRQVKIEAKIEANREKSLPCGFVKPKYRYEPYYDLESALSLVTKMQIGRKYEKTRC